MKIKKEISQEVLGILRFVAKLYRDYNYIESVIFVKTLPANDIDTKLIAVPNVTGLYLDESVSILLKNIDNETVNILSARRFDIEQLVELFNEYQIDALNIYNLSHRFDIRLSDKNMTIMSMVKSDKAYKVESVRFSLSLTERVLGYDKLTLVREFDNSNVVNLNIDGKGECPCIVIHTRNNQYAHLVVKIPRIDITSKSSIQLLADDCIYPCPRCILRYRLNGADIIQIAYLQLEQYKNERI